VGGWGVWQLRVHIQGTGNSTQTPTPPTYAHPWQRKVEPNISFVKRQLERRYSLARGPTLLERAEVFLGFGR
jgi:hypothetical protein